MCFTPIPRIEEVKNQYMLPCWFIYMYLSILKRVEAMAASFRLKKFGQFRSVNYEIGTCAFQVQPIF